MIYKTVSHQRWRLGLFFDSTGYNISEEKLILLFSFDMDLSCEFPTPLSVVFGNETTERGTISFLVSA